MTVLRIAFMGTPDFAVPALKALHESDHEIVCVYTQPPRPKGRGQKIQSSPVHEYAQQKNIPVFHPKSLKKEDAQKEFTAHNLDLAVVAAYGLILPKTVLDAPKYGCINIHASLLPRWRGASPIQRAIWEGDSETGITLMQMDEGLDTGAMIALEKITISPQTTASSLHDDLATLGGKMVLDVIQRLSSQGKISSTPQPESGTTYAHMLKKEDGKIDWNNTAAQINRQIRALNPWPGTYCGEGDNRLKIIAAMPSDFPNREAPGTILDKEGHVACEGSVLKILKLQPPGAKPMDFSAALNGHYIKIGDRLP